MWRRVSRLVRWNQLYRDWVIVNPGAILSEAYPTGSLEVFRYALFLYLCRPVTGTRRKPLMLRRVLTIALIAGAVGVYLFRESASSYVPVLAGEAQAAGTAEDAYRNHRSG